MRTTWLTLFLSVSLASCNHSVPNSTASPSSNPRQQQNGQWVLESYDSTKGFTFSKNGVLYVTKCDHISWKISNYRADIQYQSQCTMILSYLHKTIPMDDSSESINGTIGFVDGNEVIVFEITSAK
jgi:hypothetical protein